MKIWKKQKEEDKVPDEQLVCFSVNFEEQICSKPNEIKRFVFMKYKLEKRK